MSLRDLLRIGLAVLALLGVLQGVAALVGTGRLQLSMRTQADRLAVVDLASAAQLAFERADRAAHDARSAADPAQARERAARFRAEAAGLRAAVGKAARLDPTLKHLIGEVARWIKQTDLRLPGSLAGGQTMLLREDLLADHRDARQRDIAVAVDSMILGAAMARDEAARTAYRVQVTILVLVVLSLAGGLWLALRLHRHVLRPLAAIAEATRHLAAGKLDHAIAGTPRDDEIGAVARALEALRQSTLSGRELEARVLEDEQRMRDFVEATHDWLWSCDAEQTVTYISHQFTAAMGWLPAEVVGCKRMERVITDPSGAGLAAHFADLQARRPFRDLVLIVRRKDGGEAHVRTSGNPVFGPDGEFRGYRGVGSDLTAIRLQAAEADRAARLAAIGTLAGGVAHDVNNCLVPILGLADLILMTAEPGSTLAEDVEQIRAAAERARGITAQISTFSRASNDAPRIVDVADLVRSELRTHQASLPPHLRLETVIASVGAVSLPPLAIERVLANLFTNAVDAMADRPGRIVVEVAGIDPADPALKAHDLATGAYVLLSVTDEGCGIPAAAIRRVLEPFFTTKPVGKGTGLGLSVIHGIVTAQGGALTIDSVVDAGTTIGVILPLHTAADPVPAAPDRSPAPLPALAAIR